MKIALITATLAIICQALPLIDPPPDAEWELFKVQHKKQYPSKSEELLRMKIFMDNLRTLTTQNALFDRSTCDHCTVPFPLRLNPFSDMLPQEFLAKYTELKHLSLSNWKVRNDSIFYSPYYNLPKEVDWRKEGAVTPVKNQGTCNSCWAFSATGAIEGQLYRKTKKLVSLSEQNLIDCTKPYGNHGCKGGWPQRAFHYIEDNEGIESGKSYPYKAKDNSCRFIPANVATTISGYYNLPKGDEKFLQVAVAAAGPISVTIESTLSFDSHKYKDGVFYEPKCSGHLNHSVLIVGYGVSNKNEEYWLVKNSWGKKWGENGYIRMARNRGNNCGIATMATFPFVF